MSAVAPAARSAVAARVREAPAWLRTTAALSALVGVSLALRSTAIHAGFWIDEGLSVGISSHSFLDVPGVLRQDGSPPLYYLLLSVWMDVFGDGQATTHVLSLLFALAMIPAAYWAGASLFGRRSGAYAAALTATNPFLTYYAQETRMYTLVALLGLLAAATFTHAFVFRRRALLVPFALALTGLVYSHNWGLFFAAGSLVALLPAWRATTDRRALLRDGAIAYGIVAVLYLPWVPSLLFQAAHTGAPWSERPDLTDVLNPLTSILGGSQVPLALLLCGGAGLAAIAAEVRRDHGSAPYPRRTAMWTLVILPLAALTFAWLSSQVSPAFTGRYLAIIVGPLLLLAGVGLAHAGRLGIVALLIFVALWFDPRTSQVSHKSDARLVGALVKDDLKAGDVVVSVQPEQAPVLRYYFPPGLRWGTAIGPMADDRVFDWRDALDRLRAAHPTPVLDRYVRSMRPGQTLVLALPIIRTGRWGAPWTKLVRKRSAQWQRVADRDDRLVRLAAEPRFGHRALPRGARVVLYRVRGAPFPVR